MDKRKKYYFVVIFAFCAFTFVGVVWTYIVAETRRNSDPDSYAFVKPPDSFVVTLAGDYGASSNTDKVLNGIREISPDFHLTTGDFGYEDKDSPSDWCLYVRTFVGSIPFEILAGNHEGDGMPLGLKEYLECMPNKMANLKGEYGVQYYFDYPPPKEKPVARFIMISPDITLDGETFSYKPGTARFEWLRASVEEAKTAGVGWIVVVMHKDCINPGQVVCNIGPELMNYLVANVDLIIQSHSHIYGRSKPLKCVVAGADGVIFREDCVANKKLGNIYKKGDGAILLLVGTGGKSLRTINTDDSLVFYYDKMMGLNSQPTYGVTRLIISEKEIRGDFVGVSGQNFQDSFLLTR